MSKKLLSVLLILALTVSTVGVGLTAGEYFTNHPEYYRNNIKTDISGFSTQVDRLLAVAISQEGNKGRDLGYPSGYAWCAAFVSDCARIAGIPESIIPKSAGVATMYNLITEKCGGEKVTSPQRGDLVFYYCGSCGGFQHLGIVDTATHSIEGNLSNECQYIRSEWFIDSGEHRCQRLYVRPAYVPVETHKHSYYPYVTAPTCTEKGYTTFFCACGDFYTDLYMDATGHEYHNIANIPADCTTEGEKLYRCADCYDSYVEKVPSKGHSLPVWIVSSVATCTENGERLGLCSDCGTLIETQTLSAKGHGTTYITVESEPTAETAGIKTERCTDCDAVIASYEFETHTHTLGYETVIKPATCTKDGLKGLICAECNACYKTEAIEKVGHGETVSITTKVPTCTEKGEVTDYCTACGVALGTKEIDALGHANGVWTVSAGPTCTETGDKICTCYACGMVIDSEIIPSEGHGETYRKIDFEATADHPGLMSECCSKCHEMLDSYPFMLHEHKPGYSATILEPTCLKEGEKGTFCALCQSCYKTEIIPATGHDESVWTYDVPASCTTSGEKRGACPDCGEIVGIEETPALGHDEGVWVISVPPTCTTVGEETRICTRCKSVTETREIPALAHDEGVWTVSVKATCFEDGEEILTCTSCGEIVDSRVIPATGHDEGVWKVDFEPTPDREGQMSRYCSICDAVLETKTFSLHEHVEGYRKTVISPTCTNDGEGGVFCAICDSKYDSYVIPALDHVFSEWYMNNDATHSRTCSRCHYNERTNCEFTDTVYPPTCTEGGYTVHICDVCTFKYIDAYTDPLGHDWSGWVENPEQDTHTRTCQRHECGATETAVHNWSEWVYEDEYEDICLYEDTMIRYCPDCGAVQRKEVACKPCGPLLLVIGGTAVGATITGIIAAWNTAITAASVVGGVSAVIIFMKTLLPELQKMHSVTYKVDGEVYRYFTVKEGTAVPVPRNPEVAGREFAGWEPEVPEIMPDHDLVFEAKWKDGESDEDSIVDVIIPQTGTVASKVISASVTAGLAVIAIALLKKKKED